MHKDIHRYFNVIVATALFHRGETLQIAVRAIEAEFKLKYPHLTLNVLKALAEADRRRPYLCVTR